MSYKKKEPVGDYMLMNADYYFVPVAPYMKGDEVGKFEDVGLAPLDIVLPEDCDIIKD